MVGDLLKFINHLDAVSKNWLTQLVSKNAPHLLGLEQTSASGINKMKRDIFIALVYLVKKPFSRAKIVEHINV